MIKVHRPVAAEFPISSPYGPRHDPISGEDSFHFGIDFAVPVGTPIVAAMSAKIDRAGWQAPHYKNVGFGLRVRQLVHIDGKDYFLYYGHMSVIEVVEGQSLIAGTRIGLSGNSGKTSGPHLHFEVREISGKGVAFEFIEGEKK